ncbi:hypothetical protein LHYA1_G008385 [Lachnellula hyalina]|uniref:Uncharacterized protein n=1 Tax=Lachnellula hyalina TaxID=1316788 RepID=A0A8H8QVU6_9HELO|nr:uncharacterized protein LHYA1_G008385 [Lachnellula hyalina]TVY23461.1 hypothetical protein LHYA1_G008385 [Lachnellula hyalina]
MVRIIVGFLGLSVIAVSLRISYYSQHLVMSTEEGKGSPSKTLVVATVEKDDISWLHKHLPEWDVSRYVVDDASASLTVPKNKGQEAMTYLTYMIDSYDNFPDLILFMHNGRYQWHNDDPLYDAVPVLQNLQLPYLISQQYTNLRCVWTLGCPAELNFDKTPANVDASKTAEIAYPEAFQELFPGQSVPPTVGVACCAQFVVTREKIRERPVEDYKRYRQWLLDTPLDDYVSGRILEYSWHIIFGKPPVHCPNTKECYCRVFGQCDLECKEGECGQHWPFPPYSSLPAGWPTVGWDGEVRSEEVLAGLRENATTTSPTAEIWSKGPVLT